MKLIKFIFYSLLRIMMELGKLCWSALNGIEFRTLVVYLGCLLIGSSSLVLHIVARQQNQNFIEIMNHSAVEREVIFNDMSWQSDDHMTDFLLYQLRYNYGDSLQLEDTISKSKQKSPTISAYLYLLSEKDPTAEEKLLNDIHARKQHSVDNYLYTRYLLSAIQEVEDGDYYAANKLLSRYFRLHEKFYAGAPLATDHNYYYLSRLLLQDRWALSCNRETAGELFTRTDNIIHNVKTDLPLAAVSQSSVSVSFQDYVAYLKGVELLKSKSYSIALDYFKLLFDTVTSDLFKEHVGFMIIRSAFWIYDNDRTTDNRQVFMDAVKKYAPSIKSNSLMVDVNYYNDVVLSM